MKRTKHAALVLAVMLFVAILFSALFIAHESGHDCIGEDCQVCIRVAACENVLKTISGALTAAAALAAVIFAFVKSLDAAPVASAPSTPITLKVKLLD